MAKLSNSPKQALNFDLERRKSFTFRVRLKYSDGSLVNLTGCTLRFVMKSAGAVDDHFDLNNLVVNSTATIGSPTTGEAVFAFQAAELDGDPGEYGYSIVLWSPDNFSTVLAKGVINLLDNSESHSMHRLYSATAPTSALELTLRGGDVVEVEVVSLPQVPVSVDAISWPDVSSKPESFPPSTHGHTINEVTGLATELAGKQPAGNYAASVHQHTVSDVTGLQGALDGKSPTTHNHDGAYAPAAHTHTIANVTGLQTALDDKAASSHSHTIANVTGLQGALDGKQPTGSYAASTHTHTVANITDFTEATQDIVGGMITGAGGTYDDAVGTITLPSGGGGAVTSVAGRTGAVVLSSADLTDAASLATDAELTAGLAGKANTSHTHTIANVTGLQTELDGKQAAGSYAPTTHGHAIADVTGLQGALDGKQAAGSYAASAHTHAPADITGTAVITTDPRLSDARTPTAHTHTAAQISDSTTVGRALLTAADAAAARTAIGAGTSSLALGTTGSTAAAGNHTHTPASIGAAAASHTHNAADLSGVVKTVNGTAPDGAGNVTVAAGGGSAPGRIVLRSGEYIGNGAWGSNSNNYNGLRAWASIIDVPPGTYNAALCTVTTAGAAGLTAAIHIYDGAETLIGSTPAFSLATTGNKITSFPAPLTLSGVVIAVIVMSQSDGTFKLLDARPLDYSNTPVGTDVEYTPSGGLEYVLSAYSTAAPNLAATARSVRNGSPIIRLRKA